MNIDLATASWDQKTQSAKEIVLSVQQSDRKGFLQGVTKTLYEESDKASDVLASQLGEVDAERAGYLDVLNGELQ